MRKFAALGPVGLSFLIIMMSLAACSKSDKASITTDVTTLSIPNDGTSASFKVTSNVKWTATTSSSDFTVKPSSGNGTATVSVSAGANTTGAVKSSILTISGGGASASISLSQNAVSLALTPSSLEFAYTAGNSDIEIKSNTSWSIDVSSLPSWISSVSPESGIGDGTLTINTNESTERSSQSYVFKIEYAGTFSSVLITKAGVPDNAPTVPSGLKPANNATDVTTGPVFSWDASTDADGDEINYNVYYSTDQTNWTTINAGTSTSAYPEDAFSAHTVYYYYVTADDGYENGKVSTEIYSFTTGDEDFYSDGGYRVYQTGTEVSDPVKLVILGDGYLQDAFNYGGKFDKEANEAIEAFFSIEPYKTYRNYFTVYKVAAYSNEAGITNKSTGTTIDNVFSSTMDGGNSTGISCNSDKVFSYVKKATGASDTDLRNICNILIINADVYAGTCEMWTDGKNIGMAPVSRHTSSSGYTEFKNLINHECGGHGWGRFADEYVYYQEQLPESDKSDIETWHSHGAFLNVSTTAVASDVPWATFIGRSGYDRVNVYPGAYFYSLGAYRAENTSCMINNMPYYNAEQRYLIVKRIFDVTGQDFTLDKFIEKDNVKTPNVSIISAAAVQMFGAGGFRPLGRPILHED